MRCNLWRGRFGMMAMLGGVLSAAGPAGAWLAWAEAARKPPPAESLFLSGGLARAMSRL